MAFYLRKSFRAGPIRFNLSKSGIGISAGVRGARVGISGDGRSYVHGGRYGLYYRQYADRGKRRRGGGADSTALPAGPVEIDTDTGVTYASASPATQSTDVADRPSPAAPAPAPPSLTSWVLGLGAVQACLTPLLFHGAGAAATWVVLLAAWSIPTVRVAARRKRIREFGRSVIDRLDREELVEDAEISAIATELAGLEASPGDVAGEAQRIYSSLVDAIVADRRVTPREASVLTRMQGVLRLDGAFCDGLKLRTFQRAYLETIGDHELTEDEEAALTDLRRGLQIPDDAIEEELSFLAELRDLRTIRNGEIQPIEVEEKLQRSEECYFHDVGRKLERKVLRAFQRDGRRMKIMGFEIDREGDLLVTSKRVLLVHAGTTSIAHRKILDVEVDYNTNTLAISVDGRKHPVYLTTPRAPRAGAIIAALAGV